MSQPVKSSSWTAMQPDRLYNGVFALILINLVLFAGDRVLGLPLQWLYLNHNNPAWYQFITSMFLHANWAHISGNLFFLYIFGKIVEEDEGAIGVILTYLVCGLGANLMSLIFDRGVDFSLGASGAVFGLFAVSVLIKLSWNWRKILEAIILGQFVIQQVLFELRQIGVQNGISHTAHLGGALVGVTLVMVLWRVQEKRE
ncbi:rhomboid family intramembrane serine protease [Lyngbya sp. CCY1209]|uniref:rhomboid family intramembrane serine protease n=1 Tax=Lyngbya sp. CCY1209 TaxID=2886103 RepID=UPI002D2117F8|nr:rhomboid family intramembrane serine protease [Lyngbya sp. CCY1209]MEB3885735.1 rhomboid family intramembrane serine protease [Lyngbya sp. CCY1209]